MALDFKPLEVCGEGVIYSLLNRSYKDILRDKPDLVNKWQQDWKD